MNVNPHDPHGTYQSLALNIHLVLKDPMDEVDQYDLG